MERYKFDAVSRTLFMSAGFADAVSAGAVSENQSAEYTLYMRLIREIPDLRVQRMTHASPTSYKRENGKRIPYHPTKGLTYERMERFMNALPDGQKYLDEYNKLRAVAGICPSAYAAVRRWFEAQFPKYRENPLFYVKNSVDVVDFSAYVETEEDNVS